jgi:hypothetical protein
MADSHHHHNEPSFLYLVDYPVVASADAPYVISALELFGSSRTRIRSEGINCSCKSKLYLARKISEIPYGGGSEFDRIGHAALSEI